MLLTGFPTHLDVVPILSLKGILCLLLETLLALGQTFILSYRHDRDFVMSCKSRPNVDGVIYGVVPFLRGRLAVLGISLQVGA